jgi:hypothetical protein
MSSDVLLNIVFPFLFLILGWFLTAFATQESIQMFHGELHRQWRRILAGREIIILGDINTGKTALRCFLKDGKPLKRNRWGHWVPPEPTLVDISQSGKTIYKRQSGSIVKLLKDEPLYGISVISGNRKAKLTHEKLKELERRKRRIVIFLEGLQRWLLFWRKEMVSGPDLSGEEEFRQIWEQVIWDIDPHGIIYMIDSRLDSQELENKLQEIFDFVLEHYKGNPRRLMTLYIFANRTDQLPQNINYSTAIVEKDIKIKKYLDEKLRTPDYRHLSNLQYDVSFAHLSPNAKDWPDANAAIQKFGALLLRYKS